MLNKASEMGSALIKYVCLGTQNTRKNYGEGEITLPPFVRKGENAKKLLIFFPENASAGQEPLQGKMIPIT